MEQEPEQVKEEKTVTVVAESAKKKKDFVFTEKRVESLAKARLKRKENMTKKVAVPEADPESESEEEEKPKKKARVVTKERDEEDQQESFTTTATRTAGLMLLAGATFYLQNLYGKQTKSATPTPTPPTQQAPIYQNNSVPALSRQLVGSSGFFA
jgi:hypothetical protein